MKYKENLDYLFASIIYLGTHGSWWARSPHRMASELQLDEARLEEVFKSFPGIFRKSERTNPETGQYFYSLQARYAQRKGTEVNDPTQDTTIHPLAMDKLQVVINFVLSRVEAENKEEDRKQSRQSARISNLIATSAAIISSATAILVAFLVHTAGK
jgi:hypothetical protein